MTGAYQGHWSSGSWQGCGRPCQLPPVPPRASPTLPILSLTPYLEGGVDPQAHAPVDGGARQPASALRPRAAARRRHRRRHAQPAGARARNARWPTRGRGLGCRFQRRGRGGVTAHCAAPPEAVVLRVQTYIHSIRPSPPPPLRPVTRTDHRPLRARLRDAILHTLHPSPLPPLSLWSLPLLLLWSLLTRRRRARQRLAAAVAVRELHRPSWPL